jgi:site-specific recombinase XerD
LFPNPRTGGPYSVQALRKIWAKVKAATKIEIELYGATRHSFASQLLNDGEDLWRVSKLMGHSTTKMTERYAHPDIESLRVSATRMTLKRIEGQYSPEKEKAGNS